MRRSYVDIEDLEEYERLDPAYVTRRIMLRNEYFKKIHRGILICRLRHRCDIMDAIDVSQELHAYTQGKDEDVIPRHHRALASRLSALTTAVVAMRDPTRVGPSIRKTSLFAAAGWREIHRDVI